MKTSLIFIFLITLNYSLQGQKHTHLRDGEKREYNYNNSLYSISNYKDGKKNGYQIVYLHDSTISIKFYKLDTILTSFKLNSSGDTINKKDYFYLYNSNSGIISQIVMRRLRSHYIITEKYFYSYNGKDSVHFIIDSLGGYKMTYHKDSAHLNCSDSETLVSFSGGNENFSLFLEENLEYPREALRMGVTGVIMIGFTVMKDGSLSNIHVAGPMQEASLVEEALRVMKLSEGKWIPGTMCGKNVNSECRIPITFEIDDED